MSSKNRGKRPKDNSIKIQVTIPKDIMEELRKEKFLGYNDAEKIRSAIIEYIKKKRGELL